MPFSKGQQAEYRTLIAAAWQRHCRINGANPKDKAAQDVWTRGHLETATGHRSSKDCNGGRDFERATAHFEALGEAGINAHLRLVAGDLRRLKFAIQQRNPAFLRNTTDADLTAYAQGIAQQAFHLSTQPDLHTLSDAQMLVVTRALAIAADRARKVSRTIGNPADPAQ